MNLANCVPSDNVIDARLPLSMTPNDLPVSDLVIMAQADYAIALGNNLIAGILTGGGIAIMVFLIGLTIYNAMESHLDPRARAFRRQRAEIAAWRKMHHVKSLCSNRKLKLIL